MQQSCLYQNFKEPEKNPIISHLPTVISNTWGPIQPVHETEKNVSNQIKHINYHTALSHLTDP